MLFEMRNKGSRTSHRTERTPGSFIPDKTENNSNKSSYSNHSVKNKTNSRKISPVFAYAQGKHSHHKGKNCQAEGDALKKTGKGALCGDFSHQAVKKVTAGTQVSAPETPRKKGNHNGTEHAENCRQCESKVKKAGNYHQNQNNKGIFFPEIKNSFHTADFMPPQTICM